jgi:hypothetical protein
MKPIDHVETLNIGRFFRVSVNEIREYSLEIFLVVVALNGLFFLPYPFTIIASSLWSIFPGFLLYRGLFKEGKDGLLSYLRAFAFSVSLTLILFPLFALPFMIIFKVSLRVLALLFLDTIFIISFFLKKKDIQSQPQKIEKHNQNVVHFPVTFSVVSLCVLIFFKRYSITFSHLPYWFDYDLMIYLNVIQSLRLGNYPPPSLLIAGQTNTELHSVLTSFLYYSALFDIADFHSVENILYLTFSLNTVIAATLLLLAYLVLFETTRSAAAGIVAFIFLGLGTDILGLSAYLYQGSLIAYWGVPTPYLVPNKGIFFLHVPSVAHNLMMVGLEKGPPLLLSLFFVYLLMKYEITARKSLLFMIILLMFPIYYLFHLGILALFYLSIALFLVTLLVTGIGKRLSNGHLSYNFLLFFLIPTITSVAALLLFSHLKPFSSPLLIFRISPWDTARALLLYFGSTLFLALLGLIHLLRSKLTKPLKFVIVWFSVSVTSLIFADVYTYTVQGWFISFNYFLYFNSTIPIIFLAAIGVTQIISPVFKNCRTISWSFSSILLVSFLVCPIIPSFVSIYTTDYEKLYIPINPDAYTLYASKNDIAAYDYIMSNTTIRSVFLTSPRNWLIAPLTGRAIVLQHRTTAFDERNSDVASIYGSTDLGKTKELLKKYSVNYIFVSQRELMEYGINVNKFFHFPEIFPPVYSAGDITIFSVNYGALENLTGTYVPELFYKEWQLVMELNFDENGGTIAYDSSGHSNNGHLGPNPPSNGPQWYSELTKRGSALLFDGADDYVEVPHSNTVDVDKDFTFEAWIKTAIAQTDSRIISKRAWSNPWKELIIRNDKATITIGKGGIKGVDYLELSGTSSVSDNKWHQIVGVRDSNTGKLFIYVDGMLEGQINDTINFSLKNTFPLTIGKMGWYEGGAFKGIIDEVCIYNRALAADEIRQLYLLKKSLLFPG